MAGVEGGAVLHRRKIRTHARAGHWHLMLAEMNRPRVQSPPDCPPARRYGLHVAGRRAVTAPALSRARLVQKRLPWRLQTLATQQKRKCVLLGRRGSGAHAGRRLFQNSNRCLSVAAAQKRGEDRCEKSRLLRR